MHKVIFSSFICFSLHAADLGFYGHSFPISENNLVEILTRQFSQKNPELDEKLGQASEALLKKRMHRPQPVKGLVRATKSRLWKYDPTTILPDDLVDGEGRVLVAKGEKFNPLENGVIAGSLLFFDGDDAEQLNWAREQEESARWVLTKGDPLGLSEQEEREVFFDQFGALTHRLGIKALPARVFQDGSCLVIEEKFLSRGF
jgi:conjugal transfer pilus assembly protein TraW